MKKLFKNGILVAGIGLALAAGSAAVYAQQGDKQAAVTARQNFMKGQGADAKTISDFAKGNATQAAAVTAINDLVARSAKIGDQFPAGTSSSDFPGKSNAKPALWSNPDKVKAIIAELQGAEAKLADAVKSGNKQAVAADLGTVNKNGCGACHGQFREKTS